jgi:hypothetical protein
MNYDLCRNEKLILLYLPNRFTIKQCSNKLLIAIPNCHNYLKHMINLKLLERKVYIDRIVYIKTDLGINFKDD